MCVPTLCAVAGTETDELPLLMLESTLNVRWSPTLITAGGAAAWKRGPLLPGARVA